MKGEASPHAAATDCFGSSSYAIAVVHYRAYADLEHCLASVKAQSVPPAAIVVYDADPDPELLGAARRRHPDVCFVARANRGFAANANTLLEGIAEIAPRVDFALILNPDVQLRPPHAESLLEAMAAHPDAALACGKLLRPDGTIDSAGIRLPPTRRPRDRGSEERDLGQYDRSEFVFGASGAALMLRRDALEDLSIAGEVFDEDFFLYHEDTDLSWRANLLGWRVIYVATATGIHERGWRRERRFEVPVAVRRHSFKNHYLQMIKNERGRDFLKWLPVIATWEIARFGYALIFDRAVLPAYRDAWRLRGRAWKKRRVLQDRARLRQLPATVSVGRRRSRRS